MNECSVFVCRANYCTCCMHPDYMNYYYLSYTIPCRCGCRFITCRNVIFERAKFNSRIQEEGESADSFITSLYGLAEHCGFGTLHDELIRDRIVVGIRNRVRDTSLSEKLQMDPKLNLQKAVNAVRQSEAVKSQQATVRGVAKSMMTPLTFCKKADACRRGRATKSASSSAAITTNYQCTNLSASFIVNHRTITTVLTVDNHQCIHDSNVQPEMLSVTVALRKDTLSQCADLRLWMTFQTITLMLPQAPENYLSLIQFLQKFPLCMEEANHGLLYLV